MKIHFDTREVFSEDGRYPTLTVCDLCRCPGCTPSIAFEADNDRRAGFEGFRPGQWSGDTLEFETELTKERNE